MIRRLLYGQRFLEKIAIIEPTREIRYIDLLKKARAVQTLMPQKYQENIAILLPNGSDYISALWGTILAGMIAFPLNILMTEYEIFPLLKQAQVSTIITITAYRRILEEICAFGGISLKIIFIDELNATAYELNAVAYEYDAAAGIDADKPMLLLTTSGTTGSSKIVQLSEKNIETAVMGYLDKLCFDEANQYDTRYILAIPFSSAYGIMIISACLMQSFPIIVLDNVFTLDAFYMAVEKHKATHYEGSASTILLMEQMAGREIPYDISTLRCFGFGGSKVSGATIEKVILAYPELEFYQGYGMTEAAPLITKHPQKKLEKIESVGTAIAGVELAVETMDGITNTPYISGEILVRGPNIMLGYLENQAETDLVLKNGYLYTGDIGYLDDEGYLFINGRKKNIIIVRGFNVYPEEVEECIQNSLLAKDCFVYGQMDFYGKEIVCADVIPANSLVSERKIRKYCEIHLAEYKRPHKISLVKSIHKNAFGKTERK